MRTVLFFYFAAIALLVVAIIYIAQNRDYVTSITLYSGEEKEKTINDVELEPPPLQNVKKVESGCHFAFEFLKDFIKVGKPTNHKISTKPQQFRRPFTGAIRQGGFCADSMDAMEGDTVGISPCHGQGRNQEWTFTEAKQIRNEGRGILCLTWDDKLHGKRKTLLFQNCSNVTIKQKWQYDKTRKQLMPTMNPRLCVSSKESILVLKKCEPSSKNQKWNVVMTEILNIELQYA